MIKKTDKKESVVDTQTAEEKLGPDVIDSIASKEWKTAPLPTKEILDKEEHKSPKARSNLNSRKNLVQYNKKTKKDIKKKIVEGLEFKEKREYIDPFDIIILPKDYDRSILIAFLPPRSSLRSAQEEKTLYTALNAFLRDFDIYELSSSDMEDIVSLSLNRILESRLLKAITEEVDDLIDVSQTMERFRKHSDKLKSNLASRRSDRIDPKNKQNFSIVNIVYGFDDKKKEEYLERLILMEKENEEFKKKKGTRK